MEVLKTIEQVLASNLRALRGDTKQQVAARAIGIPYRTYQALESGIIPRKRVYITRIAQHYRVPETKLFLDPDCLPSAETDRLLQEFFRILAAIDDPNIRREFLWGAIDDAFGMGLTAMNSKQGKSKPANQNTKVR